MLKIASSNINKSLLFIFSVKTPRMSSGKKRKAEIQLAASAKRKRVSFGPAVSPELFDKRLPPITPVRKGATPSRRLSVPGKESRSKVGSKKRLSLATSKHAAITEESPVKSPKKSPKSKPSPSKASPKSPKTTPKSKPSPKVVSSRASPKSPKGTYRSAQVESPKSVTPAKGSPKVIAPVKQSPKSTPTRGNLNAYTPVRSSPKIVTPVRSSPKVKASPARSSPKVVTPVRSVHASPRTPSQSPKVTSLKPSPRTTPKASPKQSPKVTPAKGSPRSSPKVTPSPKRRTPTRKITPKMINPRPKMPKTPGVDEPVPTITPSRTVAIRAIYGHVAKPKIPVSLKIEEARASPRRTSRAFSRGASPIVKKTWADVVKRGAPAKATKKSPLDLKKPSIPKRVAAKKSVNTRVSVYALI